jgi:hypothetical protein
VAKEGRVAGNDDFVTWWAESRPRHIECISSHDPGPLLDRKALRRNTETFSQPKVALPVDQKLRRFGDPGGPLVDFDISPAAISELLRQADISS